MNFITLSYFSFQSNEKDFLRQSSTDFLQSWGLILYQINLRYGLSSGKFTHHRGAVC